MLKLFWIKFLVHHLQMVVLLNLDLMENLYVGTGTVSDASHLPQDLNSLSGKILRLNDDGTIPEDNPFS